ncbi:hypothetical protein IKE67_04030 [bacterium]|nr:hypothetical protein [bacterium]
MSGNFGLNITGARQRLQVIEADQQSNGEAINQNDTDISNNDASITANNSQQTQTQEGITSVESSISGTNGQISGVRAELDDLNRQLEGADEADRPAIQDAIDAKNAELANLENMIKDLENQRNELAQTLTQQQQEGDQLQQTGVELTATGDQLQQTSQTLQSEHDQIQSEIEQMEFEMAQFEDEEIAPEPEVVEIEEQPDEDNADDEEQFIEVPVQNNKGWDHYANMELEAELGRKPTQQEIRERSAEIKQRNIDAGKVNQKGDLVVGKDKTLLLRDEIDETKLQTGEEAVQAYKDGQEYLAKKAEEEEAAITAEREAYEAQIEQNKKAAQDALRAELSNLTQEELDFIQNAADMSDDEIDDAIGELLGDFNTAMSTGANGGQDVGKILGRAAKRYGLNNAQKMIGRLGNTVAKAAGKAVPFANGAVAAYGLYKVSNGDVSGVFDVLDVAVSYVPIVGTALSLIGTENMAMVLGKGYDENIRLLAKGDMHGYGFMGGHCRF